VAPDPAADDSGAVVLAVEQVSKRYRGRTVLRDVSLVARAGTVLAITGENGAGKSTLLRLCAGLDAPDHGAIRRCGRVGYCPQEPALFDMLTAAEHLRLFGAGRRQSAAAGTELLAGMDFTAPPRTLARDLSGGARQKLSLAIALLGGPRLLLLDEPYQGFDLGSYLNFWDHVTTWTDQGAAVVLVTHLLTEAHRADHVLELTAG